MNRLGDLNSQFKDQPEILCFIKEMNHNVFKFGLMSTFYDSPHGLPNPMNYSTADDQGVLISHFMKHNKFCEVVSAQSFICSSGMSTYEWQNTNKLLEKGFIGVKTGITETAGPGLAACIDKQFLNEKIRLIVVALNGKSIVKRWTEVPRLVEWCYTKLTEQLS